MKQLSAEVGDPPLQLNPGSIVHEDEQPSPLRLLPSSHSRLYLLPSPQI